MFRSLDHHQAILTRNFKTRLHVVHVKFSVVSDGIYKQFVYLVNCLLSYTLIRRISKNAVSKKRW